MTDRVLLAFEEEEVAWPDTPDGRVARRWVGPFLGGDPTSWIRNVHTRVGVLTIDGHALPVTVTEAGGTSSYVCSPYNHYVTYAAEELRHLGSPWLAGGLRGLLWGLGAVLRAAAIDRTVMVNNWLVSTNLHPRLAHEQLAAVHGFLVGRFPHHALVFRSVQGATPGNPLEALWRLGYDLVPSRQVYLFEPATQGSLRPRLRKHLRRDLRLLERCGYEVVPNERLAATDVPRLVELYEMLYLGKYSTSNPQFTERFLDLARREHILCLRAFRRHGRIDGVLGFFERDGVMTTPILGYDTTLSPDAGLYRVLSACLVVEATARGLLLHQSSGAASFKRWRGGVPHLEYNAVYCRHLRWPQRLAWRLLRTLLERLAVPLLRRYDL